MLDDVVVIGYGSKNRKSLTSSISSVKKDDLNKLSETSSTVQDMLGGTIKGVLVTQNSGEPGETMTVNVRGITSPYPISTSLTANNALLYVIDGVPMFVDSNALNPLMNIAPNDIESIDILKDASATAIYGSRGANGVIIVTTKNGRKGEKATVEAGYTLSIANPVKVFEPLNNQEFRSLQEEILRNTMDAYNYDMANFTMTTQYSMMYDPTILMAYGNFEVDWNTLMYTKFLGLNESAFGKENINWEDETRNKNAITNQYNVILFYKHKLNWSILTNSTHIDKSNPKTLETFKEYLDWDVISHSPDFNPTNENLQKFKDNLSSTYKCNFLGADNKQ